MNVYCTITIMKCSYMNAFIRCVNVREYIVQVR